MSSAIRILVVEDGHEYVESFRGLLLGRPGGSVELERVPDLDSARRVLASGWPTALFMDVVFDRIPPETLAGDLAGLITRFGGDRARALRHLAENQGFYILDALAPLLPAAMPVVLAFDFTPEPHRLEALRRRIPVLTGLPDGASLADALGLLGSGI
ncbi:MAG: hypothetical protein ABIT01_12440 [Thermoanaerobaculia bacterium]